MKKIFALMTLFIAIFALTACGEREEPIDEDQVAVDNATAALILHGLDRVTGGLNLPAAGRNNTTIAWSSSHPDVISSTGAVTRPEFGEDNVIVTLTATVTRGDASATREFEAVVNAFDIELPDPITMAELRALPTGEVVTVQGVITALWGGSAYIQDATGGFYLFRVANTFSTEARVGNEVLVTGTTAAFSGLRQFNVATIETVIVVNEGVAMPAPVVLTDFSRDALNALQGRLVSLEGFYIASAPVQNTASGYNITLMNLAGDSVVMRLDSERNLGAERRNELLAVLGTLEEGQFITINSAPLGWHDSSGGQIMFSSPSQIVAGDVLTDQARLDMALEVGITIEDADMILEDISLPSAIGFGSVVTWTSSDLDVIAADGTVTRPADGDVTVTLTATITIGSVSDTIEIEVIVKDAAFDPTPLTVSEALEISEGSVLVQGIVTSKHGFNNMIFIQDEDGTAIMVGNVNAAASLREVSVGDLVVVSGTRRTITSNGRNQEQIWTAELVEVVSSGNDVLVFDNLTIDEIIAQWPETSNKRFIITDVEIDFYDEFNHVFFVSDEDGAFQLKADVRNEAGFTPENRPVGTILVSVEFTVHQINFGDLQIVDLVVIEQE